MVAPRRRATRTNADRLGLALELLRDPTFDALLTGESSWRELPEAMAAVADGSSAGTVPHDRLERCRMTYSLTVRDHIMVAHSFTGEMFGPAQRLHGATFVVDATFRARELDADGVVVDIGRAGEALRGILSGCRIATSTTSRTSAASTRPTERLCSVIADRLVAALRAGELGEAALSGIIVTLHESHIAWASYEVEL